MTADWITPPHRQALAALLDAFDALGIAYVATGGLAGNLHGSRWPLHDLDFDVPQGALAPLAARVAARVVRGPAPYRDDEFDLHLLTLAFPGVTADLAAAETIRLRQADGTFVPMPTDLATGVDVAFEGRMVRVLPLDRLIAYKRIIGRRADLVDLEALARRRGEAR